MSQATEQSTQSEAVSKFKITAIRHPAPNRQFPNGIWYGCIDGREVSAPMYNQEAALAAAEGALLGSSYIACLASQRDSLLKNLEYKNNAQELEKVNACIAKYYEHFPAAAAL